jgi:hypothetical protein
MVRLLQAGTVGPQITLITLIVDARNLQAARACGAAAQGLKTGKWTAKSKKSQKFYPYIYHISSLLSLIFYIYYLLFILIYLIFIYLLFIPIYHLFIPPLSGIVPGKQNTVMRRHCAPEGEAQPPHDGILPACR